MTTTSESQTLITGVYRSGTEFVSQLLSGHPALSTTMYHVNALRFMGPANKVLSTAARDQAIRETATRLIDRYDIALNVDEVSRHLDTDTEVSVACLYDAIMRTLWLGGERRHWAEKCQLLWREIPNFISAMPNGRAILVVRDPRSVVCSFKNYTYAPAPAYLGAAFNCIDAMQAATRYQASLPTDRFIVVRYEDAVNAPAETARTLCAFLGLDADQASVDPAQWRDSNGAPWVANSSFQDGGEPFDVMASIDRWQHHGEPLDIAFTEFVCADSMHAFGYAPANEDLNWPTLLRQILPDDAMCNHLHRFLESGEGIQAFPTDPIKAENWEENRILKEASA